MALPKQSANIGFSLVELSIVLVILGLLVGGVLSGQSLIRAAELRAVTTEYANYVSSTYTFRDKYFALPGDMTNATSFWGIRASTGSNVACHTTIGSTTGTCNGDGDGRIDYIAGDVTTRGERFAAWQHLARAALIQGNFTGASGSAVAFVRQPGTNLPPSKLRGVHTEFTSVTAMSGDTNFFDRTGEANGLHVRAEGGFALKPEEAWNIDTKMDDGRPATGSVWTFKSSSTWSPACATTDVVSTAQYSLSLNSTLCEIHMLMK